MVDTFASKSACRIIPAGRLLMNAGTQGFHLLSLYAVKISYRWWSDASEQLTITRIKVS
jgi:hypothetical protein